MVTKDVQGKLETIQVTDNHPYWVKGSGWVDSAKLQPSMVLTSQDGQDVQIVSLKSLGITQDTYNLEVADNHNYFVGEQKVFVHNQCACILGWPINKAGKLYPDIPDLRTNASIPFPTGNLAIVPKSQRVVWEGKERAAFIKEWYDRGYTTPRGGWPEYDVHHIKPREYGGTNDFWNLAPVQRKTHQSEFNKFWEKF